MSGLHGSEPAPATRMADEDWIKTVKDRSKKREAPPGFRPSSQWKGDALLTEYLHRRDENLQWVRETQADLRGHFAKVPGATVDVYQMLLMLPAHNERHLAQIEEVKASPGFPKGAR